jgi:hypothetical protein
VLTTRERAEQLNMLDFDTLLNMLRIGKFKYNSIMHKVYHPRFSMFECKFKLNHGQNHSIQMGSEAA